MSAPASIVPWFGRAWRITVTTQSGEELDISNSSWNDEALRATFTVEQWAVKPFWYADVSIYNLSAKTEQLVLRQGDVVSISAGYQLGFSPAASLLFQGQLFQPIWEREEVANFKLTLRCMIGFAQDAQNFVSLATASGSTQADIVRRIAKEARHPIDVEQIDDTPLQQKKLPRGKVIFGTPGRYLDAAAQDNNVQFWISDKGLNVRDLDPKGKQPDLVFAPANVTSHSEPGRLGDVSPTLLGTPQQVEGGVGFRVKMDSRIKIGQLLKLDMSAIRLLELTIGNGYPSMLDQDGMYVAGGVTHRGDTRGEDWYTDVVGLTKQFWQVQPALQGPR